MTKGRLIRTVLLVLCCVIFWNILGFFWSAFVSRTPFSFEIGKPVLAGVIAGLILIMTNRM